jgi:Fis family transcriptional regulator
MKKNHLNGPLSNAVQHSVQRYFKQLNGEQVTGIYNMVLQETERPLLEVTMQEVGGNQTHAAKMLGINRNTLRKKLVRYGLDQ